MKGCRQEAAQPKLLQTKTFHCALLLCRKLLCCVQHEIRPQMMEKGQLLTDIFIKNTVSLFGCTVNRSTQLLFCCVSDKVVGVSCSNKVHLLLLLVTTGLTKSTRTEILNSK